MTPVTMLDGRKLLEAVVTSTLGAYAVVICVNQWWHGPHESRSLQFPALLDVPIIPATKRFRRTNPALMA